MWTPDYNSASHKTLHFFLNGSNFDINWLTSTGYASIGQKTLEISKLQQVTKMSV